MIVFIQAIKFHAFEIATRDNTKNSVALDNRQMSESKVVHFAECVYGANRRRYRNRVGRHSLDEGRGLGALAFGEYSHRVATCENAKKPLVLIDDQDRALATFPHPPACFLDRSLLAKWLPPISLEQSLQHYDINLSLIWNKAHGLLAAAARSMSVRGGVSLRF